MSPLKMHRVATFYTPRKDGERPKITRISAYTRDYNPSWEGCVIYEIEAVTGNHAKTIARERRLHELEFYYR